MLALVIPVTKLLAGSAIPFSSSPQRCAPLIGTWAFPHRRKYHVRFSLFLLPLAEKVPLASVLQNYRIRNISTEHTPPAPERVSWAIKPFIDHDHITTLTPHNTPPETSFFEFTPRSVFLLGFKRIHPSISIHLEHLLTLITKIVSANGLPTPRKIIILKTSFNNVGLD
jgi:hypothetical protein